MATYSAKINPRVRPEIRTEIQTKRPKNGQKMGPVILQIADVDPWIFRKTRKFEERGNLNLTPLENGDLAHKNEPSRTTWNTH